MVILTLGQKEWEGRVCKRKFSIFPEIFLPMEGLIQLYECNVLKLANLFACYTESLSTSSKVLGPEPSRLKLFCNLRFSVTHNFAKLYCILIIKDASKDVGCETFELENF